VVLALAAACFSAANDLIYRKSAISKKSKDVYFFYFFSALFSALGALVIGYVEKGSLRIEAVAVLYGVTLGILSFCTYILFLFSFNGHNTTVSVTIYRLNLIPGIALAVIFLGEVITLRRGLGILLCIVSMLLFTGKAIGENSERKYLLLSFGAFLLGGVMNVLSKVAVMHGAEPLQLLLWRFLTVAIISGMIFWSKKPEAFTLKELKYPFASGLLLMFSVFMVMSALQIGEVSVVIPITQIAFVLVAVISCIVLKEKMNPSKAAGILCAVLAVILIS
jgi:drug/metabolite transporter (DMT)-like permease